MADQVKINCMLCPEFGMGLARAELCSAMRDLLVGNGTHVDELDDDLRAAPRDGFLVTEELLETAEMLLDPERLGRTFMLDGAKVPGLNRALERYAMPGGFCASEWFPLRSLESVRYPVLRIEVADALSYERIDRYSTAHYA